MERDVLDTPMKNDLDTDATSIIDDLKNHEQARCDSFELPHVQASPFSTTSNDFSVQSCYMDSRLEKIRYDMDLRDGWVYPWV